MNILIFHYAYYRQLQILPLYTMNQTNQQTASLVQNLSHSENNPQHIQKQKKMPTQLTQQGRALLQRKQYVDASKSFSKAIMAFQYLLKNQIMSAVQTKEMLNQVIIPCYSNLALCNIHLKSFQSVILLCNQILNHNKSHVKALYRRGIGHRNLKKFEEAVHDFELAAKIDGSIQQLVNKQILQCKKQKKNEKLRQKEMARRFIQSNEKQKKQTEKQPKSQENEQSQNRLIRCIKSIIGKIVGNR